MKPIKFIIIKTLFILSIQSCSFKDSRLISYESYYQGENPDLYEKLRSKITPIYKNKKIYIDELIDVNSCGKYSGNIEIEGDSIYLIQDNSSFTYCASEAFFKVKYVIENTENKKYKFAFKFE